MFRVFALVIFYWIRVSLYSWFGLGVLRCTSENLWFWVKERLGQIWWLFEGVWVVRIRVLSQEWNIRADLVLFEVVLGCRINFSGKEILGQVGSILRLFEGVLGCRIKVLGCRIKVLGEGKTRADMGLFGA